MQNKDLVSNENEFDGLHRRPFAERRTRAFTDDNYPRALQDLQSPFGKKRSLEQHKEVAISDRFLPLSTAEVQIDEKPRSPNKQRFP